MHVTVDRYEVLSADPIYFSGEPVVVLTFRETDDNTCSGEVFLRAFGGKLPLCFDYAEKSTPANIAGLPSGLALIREHLLQLVHYQLFNHLALLSQELGTDVYVRSSFQLKEAGDLYLHKLWFSLRGTALLQALASGFTRSAALRDKAALITSLAQFSPLPFPPAPAAAASNPAGS